MSSACPSSRYGHVAAVINDEMLVWGGLTVRESTGAQYYCSPDLIECFNLSTSQWNERRATSNSSSDLPHSCGGAQIGVVQNRDIYQFGGSYLSSDGRVVYLSDVHKFDGLTSEWERIHSNDQSTPSGRESHGMCVLGKKGDEHLVMMGGYGTPIVSPIPDGSQFIPDSKYPDYGWNNEVWLFCIRKRNWIPAHCTGIKPHPRSGHSFTTIDANRAILIGGVSSSQVLNDSFLLMFSSLEWIEMKLDDDLIPRFAHSTVVVDIPTLGGPVAFLLWGYGKDKFLLSLAQMILIECKKISISDELIPTGFQSVCSFVRRGLLIILRCGGSTYKKYTERKPGAVFNVLQYDLKSVCEKLFRHNSSEPIEHEISKSDKHAQKMTEEPLLDPSLQIDRQDLLYDEDYDFLGRGACGDVFKATLKKNGREKTVAVKRFTDIRRRTKKEYEMFKKEASVLLRIEPNPFILGLIGLCAVPSFYALVTEFVSGGNLSSILTSDEEAIDRWETRVTFAKQTAKGMLHLHSNHPPVIHYDLKAENVLVERIPDERGDQFICKVADFGLSKMSGVSSITIVRQKDSVPSGTVTHIAPERYSRRPYGAGDDEIVRKVLAKKSDVYSYGVLLWEIRERQHPYQGTDRDTIRFLIKNGEELPEGQAPNVPPFFDDLMKKCTQFDPQNRPMFDDIILTLTGNESD